METHNAAGTDSRKRAAVFGLCFCYWIYLFFSSHMVVAMDAVGYEQLGKTIYKDGWVEYFRTGPNREPIYPLLISVSMRIGDQIGVHYQVIQKMFQIVFLFLSQVLALAVLHRLKVREFFKLLVILYLGFSPAIVNSSFSLYYEVIAMPFILAIILLSAVSWQVIQSREARMRSVVLGFLTGVLFLAAVFSRGVLQSVFSALLLSCLVLGTYYAFKRKRDVVINIACYVLAASLVFQPGMFFYKSLNKKYNGQFEFTNRYRPMLFGNAEKRARKLTVPVFLAHVASIPGHGVCRLFFTQQECRYCEFEAADEIYGFELPPLLKDVPMEDHPQKTWELTKERIFAHPAQYVLFMGIEFFRMFFWESTQIGFVDYPEWLRNIFDWNLFSDGVRFIISGLTLVSFGFLVGHVFRARERIINTADPDFEPAVIGFFMLLVILSYGGAYSLFSVLTRFALPVAPLYLITIAFFADRLLRKNS